MEIERQILCLKALGALLTARYRISVPKKVSMTARSSTAALPMLILSDSDCFEKEKPIHTTEDKQEENRVGGPQDVTW
jgi:hypothetical protein